MTTLPKNKRMPRRVAIGGNNGVKVSGPNKAQKDRQKNEQKKGGGGKKGGGKGKGGSLPNGMPKMFGARGGFEGVSTKRVNSLVGGLVRDEVRSIRREKRMSRRDAAQQMREARRDYRRGKQDNRHVFKETGQYLKHLQNQNQQMYNQQGSSIDAANAALQQQLGGTYTGAMDGVTAEMQRLGIDGGANLGQLQADQAFSQATAQQGAANARSTLDLGNTNANQLSNLVQGMNQGSYTAAMGNNLNARNDRLNEIRQDRTDAMDEVRDAIRDVRMSRRDLFTQLLNQLQETGWSQYMDQQGLNLQRQQFQFQKRQANKKD